jgi:transglutaminase-like putative cysteine protease
MKLLSREMILKNIVALLFALSFPLVCAHMLAADLSPLVIILFPLVKILLYNLIRLTDRALHTTLKAFSWILSLLFAAFIIIGVVITPYSSYRIWMESIYQNSPGGTVSSLVLHLCTFFSTHFALLFYSTDFIWPFIGMAFVILCLLAFTYQSLLFFISLAGFFVLSLIYLAFRFGHEKNRIRGLSLYVNLALLAVVLALLFAGEGKPKGSSFVDEGMYPFFREKITYLFPSFPLVYAVPGYGFSFNETTGLGGRPLLSPASIFEVAGGFENPLYLRTRSFDTYDGKTWSISQIPEQTEETVESYYPIIRSTRRETDEIEVKILTEYYSFLPHTLDTRQIRLERKVPPLKYGNWDIGFILEKPVKKDDTIYLQRTRLKSEPMLLDRAPYLQLPADLPEEILELAQRLSTRAANLETILMRIEHYLAINYAYDLEEDMGGGHGDFVQSFLFEQLSGYCVHFATAFIILARLNGIPARYTTGFLVTRQDPDKPAIVSGMSSHAWPEVWLEGRGWVTWEATPALDFENYEFFDDYWLYSLDVDFDGLTARQLRAILGNVQTKAGPSAAAGFHFDKRVVYSTLASIAAAAVLFLLLRLLVHLRKHALRGENRPLLLLASKIVVLYSGDSIHPPERIGWIRWRDFIIRKTPDLSRNIKRSTAILLAAVYGGRRASRRDIRYTKLLYRKLKRELRRSPGF